MRHQENTCMKTTSCAREYKCEGLSDYDGLKGQAFEV